MIWQKLGRHEAGDYAPATRRGRQSKKYRCNVKITFYQTLGNSGADGVSRTLVEGITELAVAPVIHR